MKLILLLLLVFNTAHATKNDKYFHLYGGFGELFSLSSWRVGQKTWEFGLLNQRSFGIVKTIYKEDLYLNYGPMVNQNGSPGAFAAFGYEKTFWKFCFARAEVNTGHALDNFSSSEIHLGLGIYW